MELAKSAQKLWAKTPLWKRAELLHKAAAILKEHKAPIAECLVKEIAKPAKDAVTEVQNLFWFPYLTSIISKLKSWSYGVIHMNFVSCEGCEVWGFGFLYCWRRG